MTTDGGDSLEALGRDYAINFRKAAPMSKTEALREFAEFVLRGCESGAIKSKPTMLMDPDAAQVTIQSLGDMARAALEAQGAPEPALYQCCEHGDNEWLECSREAYGLNTARYKFRALYAAAVGVPAPSSQDDAERKLSETLGFTPGEHDATILMLNAAVRIRRLSGHQAQAVASSPADPYQERRQMEYERKYGHQTESDSSGTKDE